MNDRKQKKAMGKSGGAHVTAPVLRLRELAVGIVCIALLIVWPLFMVSKQIFITNLSVRESALADSLAAVGRQCATQRLYNEKLSSTARIESIMREHRGLEYPAAGQIVVIREPGRSNSDRQNPSKFFAIIKKPFSREKG
jgi:hypothetical protein